VSARVILRGFEEQRRLWQSLPRDLAQATQDEAADPIAQAAAADIRAGYPRRTGALAAGVQVEDVPRSAVQAAARVVNTHPLAGLFEHGTQARHTALGASRGSMPAGNVFIPRMQRAKAAFWSRVGPIMERAGLRVTGRA
jgi:hypothetical protein